MVEEMLSFFDKMRTWIYPKDAFSTCIDLVYPFSKVNMLFILFLYQQKRIEKVLFVVFND